MTMRQNPFTRRAAWIGMSAGVAVLCCVEIMLGGHAGNKAQASDASQVEDALKLLYQQKFENAEALKDFVFTDSRAWRYGKVDDNDGGALELHGGSKYAPPHRSPLNIALISDKAFGNFTLDFEAKQTGKEYGHRDMCVFFGFEDPAHFFYTHIATKGDAHAHSVFIVNDAPRLSIAKERTEGFDWGKNEWHNFRIVRDATRGTITVFADDMDKPIMTAENQNFSVGRIGFGSFDDTGMIRNIVIKGDSAHEVKGDADPFVKGRKE